MERKNPIKKQVADMLRFVTNQYTLSFNTIQEIRAANRGQYGEISDSGIEKIVEDYLKKISDMPIP